MSTAEQKDPGVVALADFSVAHAGRRKVNHPELQREIYGQTSVRYLRFLRRVRVQHLELSVLAGNHPPLGSRAGRWVPYVPTHPAHITVAKLDRTANRWVNI